MLNKLEIRNYDRKRKIKKDTGKEINPQTIWQLAMALRTCRKKRKKTKNDDEDKKVNRINNRQHPMSLVQHPQTCSKQEKKMMMMMMRKMKNLKDG